MRIASDTITQFVEDVWVRSANASLTGLLEIFLFEKGLNPSALSNVEEFERVLKQVKLRFAQCMLDCDTRGIVPRFRFSEIDPDQLIYQATSVPRTSLTAAKRRISVLPWRAFELLCCSVLQLAGVTFSKPMRGTKEGGIDVFGVFDPSEFVHPALWKGTHLRVFCQAKKGRVSEPVVRLLKNDLDDLVKRTGRAYNLLPSDLKQSLSAVQGGIFSAVGFTNDALEYARRCGFFMVDPEKIVEILVSGRERAGHLLRRGDTPGGEPLEELAGQLGL